MCVHINRKVFTFSVTAITFSSAECKYISLQARLVLLAFEDLEVPGCTFHKEEHQSMIHNIMPEDSLFALLVSYSVSCL